MKRVVIYLFFIFTCSTAPLFSMTITKSGKPYWERDILWQAVKFSDKKAGFAAAMPGSPVSGLYENMLFSQSIYQGCLFEIQTEYKYYYSPPQQEEDFVDQIADIFKDKEDEEYTITSIPSDEEDILYVVEMARPFPVNHLIRAYCSNNKVYWLIFKGKDLALAQDFFNKFKITR